MQTFNLYSPTPNTHIHIFGIRHHGPGSARSLCQALTQLQPDIVLVEGPPDAEAVLPLLIDPQMRPPVALLIYSPENPQQAAYYPFAVFSPEWQAIHYALTQQIPVRFIDLPQTHRFAMGMGDGEKGLGDGEKGLGDGEKGIEEGEEELVENNAHPPNTQHPIPNTQHPTPNTQHPPPNPQPPIPTPHTPIPTMIL